MIYTKHLCKTQSHRKFDSVNSSLVRPKLNSYTISIFTFKIFFSDERHQEGRMRPDEPSKVREMYRHGELDLLERSFCVAQLESQICVRIYLRKFF